MVTNIGDTVQCVSDFGNTLIFFTEENMERCQSCGREFTGNYCPQCGEPKQKQNVCPLCKGARLPQTKFCPQCGYEFPAPKQSAAEKTPLLFARAKLQKEIKIPQGITFLAYDAFYGCENLARAVLPESLTYLGKRAFAECASLKSVSLPSALTEIKAQTFLHCVALDEITLPDAIVSIGESAFEGCRALTAAVLPQNLRVLGREAFARCESLTEVTIFPKIAMIGGYAFNGCKRLTDIRFYGTRAQWEGIKKGRNIFSPAHPAIHCTDETVEN